MTQNEEILAHLQSGQSITAMQALEDFGCFRLAARIKNLRDKGHLIKTEQIVTRRTKKHVARYSL